MSYRQIDPADLSGFEEVRITTTSGKQETLREPREVADTLTGLTAYGDPTRIPVADIEEIAVGEKDTWKTVAFVAGVVVATAAVAGLAYLLIGLSQADCIGLCLDE
jgi:hypothetical protein